MSRDDDRRRNSRQPGCRTTRLRERLKEIKPEDHDMIELIAVLKGIMDIVDDDGEELRRAGT